MGWLFNREMSRAELIKDRTVAEEKDGRRIETIAQAVCTNVLWKVVVVTQDNIEQRRYIACDLLKKSDGAWGYKDMYECEHPYYYSCPLRFLDMVPVECQAWRDNVLLYHVKKQRKFEVGKTYKLLSSCDVPEVTITNLRPLRGSYNGITYRVPKRLLV